MAKYDIQTQNGKTTVTKRRPVLNFITIAFGALLVIGEIRLHWWLIIPTLIVAALAIAALRTKNR